MQQFVFPAVFYFDEDEVLVSFPDLKINTEAKTIEEAYLLAKDYLKLFCKYALKYDLDLDLPTKYEKMANRHPEAVTMLVDAILSDKEWKE